jgi:hypothetical protein
MEDCLNGVSWGRLETGEFSLACEALSEQSFRFVGGADGDGLVIMPVLKGTPLEGSARSSCCPIV